MQDHGNHSGEEFFTFNMQSVAFAFSNFLLNVEKSDIFNLRIKITTITYINNIPVNIIPNRIRHNSDTRKNHREIIFLFYFSFTKFQDVAIVLVKKKELLSLTRNRC